MQKIGILFKIKDWKMLLQKIGIAQMRPLLSNDRSEWKRQKGNEDVKKSVYYIVHE